MKIHSSTDAMTPTNAGKSSFKIEITKMANSAQAEAAQVPGSMILTDGASFFTPWGRRKLKKNFYPWSLEFVERGQDFSSDWVAVQDDLLSTLEKSRHELAARGYHDWMNLFSRLETELRPEVMILILLRPQCTILLRTFMSVDKFLSPVYSAFLAEKISKVEFERIKSQVEIDFETTCDLPDQLRIS